MMFQDIPVERRKTIYRITVSGEIIDCATKKTLLKKLEKRISGNFCLLDIKRLTVDKDYKI